MRRTATIGLLTALTLLGAAASAQAVPELTGRVVDTADLLSPATESTILNLLAAHEDSTSNQVAVLTIPSLDGAVLEEYATTVFRSWALGQADRDNGVLLLISRDDRQIRIEVGYGLEGSLTDATAGSIIRNEMTPRFRDGDFDGGTLGAVTAILGALDGTYVAEESPDRMPLPMALLMSLVFLAFPLGLAVANLTASFVQRYVGVVFSSFFVAIGVGMTASIFAGPGMLLSFLMLGGAVGYLLLFIVVDLIASRSPEIQRRRAHNARKTEAFRRARKAGAASVVVDGVSYSVPTASSSGGGFSGGGGSSGGGGASGGW
jgi:uncharacterized protein